MKTDDVDVFKKTIEVTLIRLEKTRFTEKIFYFK